MLRFFPTKSSSGVSISSFFLSTDWKDHPWLHSTVLQSPGAMDLRRLQEYMSTGTEEEEEHHQIRLATRQDSRQSAKGSADGELAERRTGRRGGGGMTREALCCDRYRNEKHRTGDGVPPSSPPCSGGEWGMMTCGSSTNCQFGATPQSHKFPTQHNTGEAPATDGALHDA